MSRASTWLLEYGRDVFSQSGEDGIIERILEVIPHNDKWCVEFGAWDGLFVTNTRHAHRVQRLLGSPDRSRRQKFHELQRQLLAAGQCLTVNRYVGFGEDDNLDQILRTPPVP